MVSNAQKAELDGIKRANIAVGGASYTSDSSPSSDDEFNGSIFAKHARVDLPDDGTTGNGNGGKPNVGARNTWGFEKIIRLVFACPTTIQHTA